MGYIYFVDNEWGKTKIGYTRKDPNKRISKLQIPNLNIKYIFETQHPTKLEIALHNRFKSNSEGREWFDLNRYSLDEIKKICIKLDNAIDFIYSENTYLNENKIF